MNAGGSLVNTATADSDQTDPTSDTNSIPVKQTPAITIDKKSATLLITGAGQVVPYTFLVSNTGNVTLTGITVSDPRVTSISCSVSTLNPGASTPCPANSPVPLTDMYPSGNLVNTATTDSDQTDPTSDTNSIPVKQ